jgi:hypothetical protein
MQICVSGGTQAQFELADDLWKQADHSFIIVDFVCSSPAILFYRPRPTTRLILLHSHC